MHTSRSNPLSLSLSFAALAACTMFASSSAAPAETSSPAGVVRIEVEFFTDDRSEPTNRATVWTAKRRVRIEQHGAEASDAPPVFLYRGDQDRLVSLSRSERSYVAIERRLLAMMGGGGAAVAIDRHTARREVDDQLENVPADQQRLFRHLLGGAPIDGRDPDEPLVVTRTDERATVAGMPCRRVKLSRGRHLLAVGCVADWDTVGLTPDDVEVFRSLAQLTHDAMGSRLPIPIEIVPGQPLDLVVQLGGFPLAFERAGDVPGRNAIRVASVERIAADDSLFEIPAGYAERSGFSGLGGLAGLLGGSRSSAIGGGAGAGLAAAAAASAVPAAPDPAAGDSGSSTETETGAAGDASASADRAVAAASATASAPASSPAPRPAAAGAWRTVPLHRSISLFEDPE